MFLKKKHLFNHLQHDTKNKTHVIKLSLYYVISDGNSFAMKLYLDALYGRCLLIKKYFCAVYDFAGKADLSKDF